MEEASATPPEDSAADRQRVRLRIALLLLVLSVVSMWASSVVTRRKLLTTWKATLEVGVVLLGPGGVRPEKRELIQARLPELDKLIEREFRKYRPGSTLDPVHFVLAGTAGVEERPPMPPEDAGYVARALHAFQLSRYVADINRKAGINTSEYDARIYVMLEPVKRSQSMFVEGVGAKDGEVGFVTTNLDEETLDLTLLAVGHEFLHTVGATDKYDADGHTDSFRLLPEPDREPRYPQRFAEIMVGEITLSPTEGRLPDTLAEVAVGPVTAREVGWVKEDDAPAVASRP
jgi:hypothetical protein